MKKSRKELQTLFAASFGGKKNALISLKDKSEGVDDVEEQSSTRSIGRRSAVRIKKGGTGKE